MISGNPQLAADWQANRPAARETIRQALALEDRNVKAAAARLGISRRTLTRYLAEEPELAVVSAAEVAASRGQP
jgi:transcriptional regulator with PAS, ATPase and Fis domain